MNGNTTRVYTTSPDIRVSLHDDGFVLLDTAKGFVYTSNRTGAQILEGISEGRSLGAIVAGISQQNGVCPAVVEAHAEAFIDELKRRGILRVANRRHLG